MQKLKLKPPKMDGKVFKLKLRLNSEETRLENNFMDNKRDDCS
jgi:hypothetical protein